MKKKSLLGVLSAICALTAVGATACGGGGHTTHTYTDSVTAPTCTEQGYTTHTCECGDTKTDTYVNALGHDFASYVSNGDGTETATCSRNGCAVTDTREETPPVTPPEDATQPETPQTYTVTLTKNIDEAGTVTGAGEYEENTSITLTATTNEGYTFLGWYQADTCVSTETTFSFNLTQNTTMQATWEVAPPPATYVNTSDVFDAVFETFDGDALVNEMATAINNTKYSNYELKNVLAFDYDLSEDGCMTFYVHQESNKTGQHYIKSLSISGDMSGYSELIASIKSFSELKNEFIAIYGNQIEENSAQHTVVIEEARQLLQKIESQANSIITTIKDDISFQSIFAPTILSEEEMTNLGIEDMNEFSYALLNNTRGSGYDKVTGFTQDEIIATYVDTPYYVDIDGYTSFKVVTVSAKGISETKVFVAVNGSSEAHTKFIQNSADVEIDSSSDIATYSSNVIVYNNGVRVTE